jgi:hypothetical protein
MFEPPPSAAASTAAIQKAVGDQAIAATQAQIEADTQTMEGQNRVTKATERLLELEVEEDEKVMENVRRIGAQKRKLLGRKEPFNMAFRKFFSAEEQPREAEYGAYREYETLLTPEELRQIKSEFPPIQNLPLTFPGVIPPQDVPIPPTLRKWHSLTALQKWQALTRSGRQAPQSAAPPALEPPPSLLWPPPEASPQSEAGPVGPVSYNYDHRVIHQTIFNPVVGMNKQDLRIEPPYLG